jgi:hypothetical protein
MDICPFFCLVYRKKPWIARTISEIEGKNRFFAVRTVRAVYGGRKFASIGRIGEMLGFQAESGVFGIPRACLADYTIEEIPRIELNPRLGGGNPDTSPAGGVSDLRTGPQFSNGPVYRITMVIALPHSPCIAPANLGKVFFDGLEVLKIKGSARHRQQFTRRQQGFVALHIGSGIEF